jgi:hypothetical protein
MEKLIGNLAALKISWRHFSAQLRSMLAKIKKRDLACQINREQAACSLHILQAIYLLVCFLIKN